MSDPFYKFKPMSIAAQRKLHRSNVLRIKNRLLGDLYDKHEVAILKVRELRNKISSLSMRIGPAEDIVANAADKEFCTWKWRHDPVKLKMVSERMAERTKYLRAHIAELEDEIARLEKPYLAGKKAIEKKARRFL